MNSAERHAQAPPLSTDVSRANPWLCQGIRLSIGESVGVCVFVSMCARPSRAHVMADTVAVSTASSTTAVVAAAAAVKSKINFSVDALLAHHHGPLDCSSKSPPNTDSSCTPPLLPITATSTATTTTSTSTTETNLPLSDEEDELLDVEEDSEARSGADTPPSPSSGGGGSGGSGSGGCGSGSTLAVPRPLQPAAAAAAAAAASLLPPHWAPLGHHLAHQFAWIPSAVYRAANPSSKYQIFFKQSHAH